MTRKFGIIAQVLFLFVLSAFLLMSCSGDDDDDDDNGTNPPDLEAAINIEPLMTHLQKLQEVASNNNGHRAAGSKGYDASIDYIRSVLSGADYIVTEQTLEIAYFEELEQPVLEMIAPSYTEYAWLVDFQTLTFSGSGEVQSEIVFIDPMIPPGEEENSSTSGCDPEDFNGIDLTGKIAVIQRGSCQFEQKARNAQNNGAAAVIIFNEGQAGRKNLFSGTLSENTTVTIPVLASSYFLGEELYNLVMSGQSVTMHLRTNTVSGMVDTSNLLMETPTGDENRTIMLGAHLDSVSSGPGINDNGSGSVALLELAAQIAEQDYQPRNRIRFAWWTAEEIGLVGSLLYLDDLQTNNPAELDKIAVYMNYDMVGSPNYVMTIIDADQSDFYAGFSTIPDGSTELEQTFIDYFASRGLPTIPSSLSGSDHVSFAYFGIPACGLFTGAGGRMTEQEAAMFGGTAGQPYDPCYHQACDTTDNISQTALLQSCRAIASIAQFYGDYEGELQAGPRPVPSPEQLQQLVSKAHQGHELLHRDRLWRDKY